MLLYSFLLSALISATQKYCEAICEWDGITCDQMRQDIVVSIELPGNNIAGPISPALGLLTSLMHINLSENYISGNIPHEISTLPNLTTFKLNHNRIKGKIPHFASKNLLEVDLSHNVLDGLYYFDEQYADFEGGKDNHYKLQIFDASHNALKGFIPSGINMMLHLKTLNLSFNMLYGTLPSSIGDLKELEELVLSNNNLIGTIPSSLTQSDLSLIDLILNHNDLSGTIPTGFANIPYLKNLLLFGNKLTGTVPSPICALNINQDIASQVDDANSQGAELDGCNSIACPTNSASKTGVYPCLECGPQGHDWYLGHVGKCLHLNENVLLDKIYDATNGPMWKESTGWTLTNVDKCTYSGIECNVAGHVVAINLTDHGLSGTIPQEFGMFKYLESIDLSNNKLTGFLPSDFRFLPLQYLDVSGNKLEGFVPPLLCVSGDINGNGQDENFSCDTIACPSGTWSPIGMASHSGEGYKCQDCMKSHTYLGSRHCGGSAEQIGLGGEYIPGWIHLGRGAFAAIITLPLVIGCVIVACATTVILRRRRHSEVGTLDGTIDGTLESEKDPLGPLGKSTLNKSNTISESSRTMTSNIFGAENGLNFNYDDSSDSDDDNVLVRNIGTGLPYDRTLHRTESLHSLKENQVDDDINYPIQPSEVERTSVDESEKREADEESAAKSTLSNKSDRSTTSNRSVTSNHSGRSSRSNTGGGSSSRLSQEKETWLDVPDPV